MILHTYYACCKKSKEMSLTLSGREVGFDFVPGASIGMWKSPGDVNFRILFFSLMIDRHGLHNDLPFVVGHVC